MVTREEVEVVETVEYTKDAKVSNTFNNEIFFKRLKKRIADHVQICLVLKRKIRVFNVFVLQMQ